MSFKREVYFDEAFDFFHRMCADVVPEDERYLVLIPIYMALSTMHTEEIQKLLALTNITDPEKSMDETIKGLREAGALKVRPGIVMIDDCPVLAVGWGQYLIPTKYGVVITPDALPPLEMGPEDPPLPNCEGFCLLANMADTTNISDKFAKIFADWYRNYGLLDNFCDKVRSMNKDWPYATHFSLINLVQESHKCIESFKQPTPDWVGICKQNIIQVHAAKDKVQVQFPCMRVIVVEDCEGNTVTESENNSMLLTINFADVGQWESADFIEENYTTLCRYASSILLAILGVAAKNRFYTRSTLLNAVGIPAKQLRARPTPNIPHVETPQELHAFFDRQKEKFFGGAMDKTG